MNQYLELERARELINFACRRTQKDLPGVRVEFSNRLTRCMGIAKYRENLIVLSAPIFQLATEADRRSTIIHEVCHLLGQVAYGRIKSHGYEWKQLMRICGEKPVRCHSVDIASLRKKTKRYLMACMCPQGCLVGSRHYGVIMRGHYAVNCRRCLANLHQGGLLEVVTR